MKKITEICVILLLMGNITLIFSQSVVNPEITAEEIQSHINYLASDKLKGRDTGSDGCFDAAKYIENEFTSYGLTPFFKGKYLQEFPFISSIELTENNSLSFIISNEVVNPVLYEDYITVPFSGNAKLEAEIVFAGFGISAPELGYDDYKNINVEDKVVVVLKNHPDTENPHSEFDKYSSLRKKSSLARDKGALGILFVNGFENYIQEDKLVDFKYDRGGAITKFAVVNAKREIIEQIFKSNGLNFKAHYSTIISEKKPASFIFSNAKIKVASEVIEIEKTSWNVSGYIPSKNSNFNDEFIVIGAHFDHLGIGKANSLYHGDEPQIHNGADDNASGTAGLLELAEKFASIKDKLRRNIVFTAFSGEELGLLGSSYFVNNLPIQTNDIVTMINMDMIGRLNDEKSLIVYGTGTSPDWKVFLEDLNAYDLNLTFNDEGYGPSDHSSFYAKQIPVLFFFTGTHPDYHKPTDDADKINSAGEEIILNYVYDFTYLINNLIEAPEYILVENKNTGQMPGSKVWVGTIPDFAGDVDGYKISGVSDGSPAQIGGLSGGDIIIKFGEKKISNIYDFTFAIADYLPGDTVDVVVKRGEETISFKITLSAK